MAVDFGLTRKLAGFGRDAGRTARDFAAGVIEDARRPGPEIKVDHFGPNDVTTASGLVRVGTSLLAGSRRRANFDAEQRKAALQQTYTEAMTERMHAAAVADLRGPQLDFKDQRAGETDEQYIARMHALNPPSEARSTEMTPYQKAQIGLDTRRENRLSSNDRSALTTKQAIDAQTARLTEIDRAAAPKGIVESSVVNSVKSESASLLDRIFQPGTPRFDRATADSARSVLGLPPSRGRTPDGDAKVAAAITRWENAERQGRLTHARDSLLTERRFAVEALQALSSGMSPEQAAFMSILRNSPPGAPADTTRR